jgi:hypothetical protein
MAIRRHQLQVVLGQKESIASTLRQSLFSHTRPQASDPLLMADEKNTILERAKLLAQAPSSPCYLILCDGKQAAVIEKDLLQGKIRTTDKFIVQTNHDTHTNSCCGTTSEAGLPEEQLGTVMGLELWVEESSERMQVVQDKWSSYSYGPGTISPDESATIVVGTCIGKPTDDGITKSVQPKPVPERLLRRWVRSSPTTNECTHFSCILDPLTGGIRWLMKGDL